jgi:hypothetical protein
MIRGKLLAGVVTVLAVLLAAGGSQLAEAGQQVPYRASGPERVVWEGPHDDCGPGRLKVEVEGSGQATHLGRYSIVRHHCFNLATFNIEDGYFEQTAANGDTLWGTYTGFTAGVLETAADGSPVVIVISSPTAITGGTGRFASAEGAGTTQGVFNLATESGDFTFTGWVAYAASDRGGQ